MNTQALRSHWFFWVAPVVIAVDVLVGLYARGQVDRILEAGLLFDLAVLVPALYWLCYRKKRERIFIRVAALACLGIWLALKLVPEAERDLLNYVAPIRYAGLAVLIALELAVMLAIYRTIFSGGTVEEAVSKAPADMPPWAVKLMALEARFWRTVWSAIRRLTGRR
jgi:hypothetical protein